MQCHIQLSSISYPAKSHEPAILRCFNNIINNYLGSASKVFKFNLHRANNTVSEAKYILDQIIKEITSGLLVLIPSICSILDLLLVSKYFTLIIVAH